jgi:tetratricopeptide (TPR) repeat protein
LEGLSTLKVAVDLEDSVSQAKGMALFYRSWALCNLLQTFSVPYDSTTASTDLGIPLRLSSDPNLKSVRSTQKECYDQIISDIKSALSLLPNTTSSPTKPSKWAANAFLARLYLSLGSYVNALNYSNMCLQQNGTLNDYNLLNLPGTNTLTSGVRYLNEDIFHTIFINYSLSKYGTGELVDSPFYNLYDSNDLRKKYFFSLISPNIYFRGTYELIHGGNNYGGLATNEIYLIRAECNARQGNVNAAMADLNKLLGNRYRTGKYINRVATDANDALNKILEERRKELCFRGLRWTDLKRLNKDPQFATTLTRIVKGVVYTLRPNDPQYVFNIPDLEIQESGIQQNDR